MGPSMETLARLQTVMRMLEDMANETAGLRLAEFASYRITNHPGKILVKVIGQLFQIALVLLGLDTNPILVVPMDLIGCTPFGDNLDLSFTSRNKMSTYWGPPRPPARGQLTSRTNQCTCP